VEHKAPGVLEAKRWLFPTAQRSRLGRGDAGGELRQLPLGHSPFTPCFGA